MQVGIVDDAERALVDKPPDAGFAGGPDDEPGALGVDEAQALAAVEVARDRGQVDHRVDAGQGRAAGRPGDVADARLHGAPLAGCEAPPDRASSSPSWTSATTP